VVTIGTPGYISPECLLQRGYDMSVDHWAIGILIYEMIAGSNPFFVSVDMKQMDLFQSIVKDDYKAPLHVSMEATDIVSQLLIKDPAQRLGSLARGVEGIIEHPWFHDLDVDALRKRQLPAPWVPDLEDPFDVSFFDDWSKLPDKTSLPQKLISRKHEQMFKDF
jgi:serine/threonine protein kinase